MKVISLSLFILVLSSCALHRPSFKGKALNMQVTDQNKTISLEKRAELDQYIASNMNTTGMLILQDGQVIYEYGNTKDVSYIASCRKSVLSILYGKYVEDGTIDLNESIGAMGIDDNSPLLPIEKKATVENIITSRSGVFHIPANGGYDEGNILERGSVEPGSYFVYNNWDFNVAGHILELKSGNSVYEELEQQLAIPLGFEDWNIKNQRRTVKEKKSQYSAYHIYISTRDMAKIGQMMLNEGQWNGKQIISKEWIQKVRSTYTPVDVVNERSGKNVDSPIQFSYSYMWWVYENLFGLEDLEGAYEASGYGGQFITIIPKHNIVIAHKTKLDLLTLVGMRHKYTPSWKYWDMMKFIFE